MTPNPVKPDDIKGFVPAVGAKVCDAMVAALLGMPAAIYRWFKWMFDSDGTLSNLFLQYVYQPGDLKWSASPNAPKGFLLCDGSAVSRTTYSDLFAQLNTVWGIGDGSTTFNLPDARDKFPIGAGNTVALGGTGGEATHTLIETEIPSHYHQLAVNSDSDYGPGACEQGYNSLMTGEVDGTLNQVDLVTCTETVNAAKTGGDQPHNNLPPYFGCYVYIKY